MGQPDEIKMKLLFCFDKIVFLFHLYDKVKTKKCQLDFSKVQSQNYIFSFRCVFWMGTRAFFCAQDRAVHG